MGRRKKKNKDLQKTGVIALVCVIGALGYVNFINGNISVPKYESPNFDIKSTPFYQKLFGAKNEARVQENLITENVIDPIQAISQNKNNEVKIFFLGRSANKDVYMPVYRRNSTGGSNIEYAVKCLLQGPTSDEKAKGAYSEIPQTKLININETPNKVYIDVSHSFAAGGGADSIYKRMYQLIKTVNYNTDKPVYLLIDGHQVEMLGGEGLMIKQPLNGSSLNE